MGELWRDLVDLLRRRPALWVPVLVADLLGYLVDMGRNALLVAVVLHQTAHQSALGGPIIHGPMSASAMEGTTILALLLSWLTYFVRLLLYAGAFIAIAALVEAYSERVRKPAAELGPALQRSWGGILELSLRALSVYAIAALLFTWLAGYVSNHGHKALLHNLWFDFVLRGLLLRLILAVLLAPVALRVLSGSQPDKPHARLSQQFAAILALVISLLALFVGYNSRELAQVPPAARYPLEIVGSLLVALPYVLLFTGLALLARRLAKAEESQP